MTDYIFIFTFSPVQPFIAQARRAADLYSGSQILVELAKAAAKSMKKAGAELIYPASLDDDTPNRLVVKVTDVDKTVLAAQAGFDEKWQALCKTALDILSERQPKPDNIWKEIWERQTENLWEITWAAAELKGANFHDAYQNARRAVEAAKRTRIFNQTEEDGLKDSLSGERSSLRTGTKDGREYWSAFSTKIFASKLKPDGRERLDSIGAIKRFGKLDEAKNIPPFKGFPSTSTIASLPYLRKCRAEQSGLLKDYAEAIQQLDCFAVRDTGNWLYDGDLFYKEMLDEQRLIEDYHLGKEDVSPEKLKSTRDALAKLNGYPSAYYAIIAIDGDKMGKRIDACESIKDAHEISQQLTQFAVEIAKSRGIPAKQEEPDAYVIYNGGDDLLAMTPLENAFKTANEWQAAFKREVEGTASAGIAIVHHQAPLSAGLRSAREALEKAKHQGGRDAICISVIKRGGAPVEILSKWDDAGAFFPKLIEDFTAPNHKTPAKLASKFAYSVLEEAHTLTALKTDAQEANLGRLLKRHTNDKENPSQVTASELATWARKLNEHTPPLYEADGEIIPQGLVALGNWLVTARFIAQGGEE